MIKGQPIQFIAEGHPMYEFNPGDHGEYIERHDHPDGTDGLMAWVRFEGERIFVPSSAFRAAAEHNKSYEG